jgi:hypothetical protein
MKIIGGTYGLTGSVWISHDNKLVVNGARKKAYQPSEIKKATASQTKNRSFGCFGFIVGAIMLALLIGMFFGPIGALIGIILAGAGSFYTSTKHLLHVEFTDENSVIIECTPRFISKIISLKNR